VRQVDLTDREALAEAIVNASTALLGIAVRSVSAVRGDVTLVQHRVLVLLEAHGVLSIGAIADGLGVDQSVASRHCARLEELGLLDRSRSVRDARSRDVRLTPFGRARVADVRAARRRAIEAVLVHLPDHDAETVRRSFEAFSRAVELAEGPATAPAV
jgi:DNA-binding MarR family transcriptional regulator